MNASISLRNLSYLPAMLDEGRSLAHRQAFCFQG
jgi:hypothetical protein